MKYLVALIIGIMLFGVGILSENKSAGSVPQPNSPLPLKNGESGKDFEYLVSKSKFTVIGKVEEIFYVVDEEKMEGKKPASNGIVQLPNLREAIKGLLIRFRIEESIYYRGKKKNSGSVDIYIQNGYSVPTDTNIPVFEMNKRYLVFLSDLEKGDYVRGTSVIQPTNLSKGSFNFDHKSAFKVTEQNNGYFNLTESNVSLISEVRRVAKNLK